MWKTVACKNKTGNKNFYYTLVCDKCNKVYKERGKVVKFSNLWQNGDDDAYIKGGWHLFGGLALCPKCEESIESDFDEIDESDHSLDLKSWETWNKRNNPELVVERHRYGTKLINVVWPTLRKYKFKRFNVDSDFLNQNDKPRDVAIRAIYRGDVNSIVSSGDVEFVYFLNKEKHECESVDIFWRRK